jgi:hypothetical protein
MKKKKYIKEENKREWPGKSRGELAELVRRIEEEEEERKRLMGLIMLHFDEALKGLYKEIKVPKQEQLTAMEEVECRELLRKQLNKLSVEGLKDVLKRKDKYGLEYIREFIYKKYWEEEEKEKEEEEEEE